MGNTNKTFIQISRFDQILADLRDRIKLPEFAAGSKLPSERQLALEYQCSQATMNKVISTLISEDLLERTEKRGAFVKEKKQGDITLLGWMASEHSGVAIWERLVEDFQTLPEVNLHVNTQILHYSEVQQEIILLAGKGEAPDVAHISRNWTGHLSSLGLIESLEGKLSENIIADHLTWVDDSKQSNQQLRSVDYGFVPMLLYINCDLLEQCGLDSTKDPQTLMEFVGLIQRVNQMAALNEKGQRTYGYLAPNLSDELTGQWFLPWLYATGGDFLDPDGQLQLVEQEAVEALTSYHKCLKSSPGNISAWDVRKLFKEGHSAFLIDGPKGEDFFNNSKINIRATALPRDPQGNSTSVSANHALALFSQSKEKSMGSKLIEKILSDSQRAALNYKKEGIVPTGRSLLKEDIYSQPYAQLVLKEALNNRRIPSYIPSYQLAIGLLGNAVSRVLNDDADPASVLGETAANIKFILKERDD
jgi:multiple sugar transport system substrate-binding protein